MKKIDSQLFNSLIYSDFLILQKKGFLIENKILIFKNNYYYTLNLLKISWLLVSNAFWENS